MNNLEIFNNKQLEIKTRVLKNDDGSLSINVEDVARGFGWVDSSKSSTDGESYIRWNTINRYLRELNFSQQVAKDDFIPEELFYMLGMKANNEVALKFQRWLAFDVIPSIRKKGYYKLEKEVKELTTKNKKLESELEKYTTGIVMPFNMMVKDVKAFLSKTTKECNDSIDSTALYNMYKLWRGNNEIPSRPDFENTMLRVGHNKVWGDTEKWEGITYR